MPLGPGTTIYQRIGDVFAWIAIVISVLLAGVAATRRQQPTPRQLSD